MKIMKNIAAILITMLLFSGSALAETKVVFVNTALVLERAPQAAQARENLKQAFAPREAALLAEQEKLKAMDEKLKRDGAVMSEENRRKLEREMVALQRELKRKGDEFAEDLNLRRNEELGKVLMVIQKAIDTLATENDYDLVLDKNAVVYVHKRVDITEQVIELLTGLAATK